MVLKVAGGGGGGAGSVTSVGGNGTVNGITLTGLVTSTGNLTLGGALANVANNQLVNSNVTINGSVVNLGQSTTVTANTTGILTLGTGLTGGSFNGSSNVTANLANTTVTAGMYGNGTTVAAITVDPQGRITSAANVTIQGSGAVAPGYWGSWFSNVTQSAAVINTAYGVTYNNADSNNNGFTYSGSNITVITAGVYNLQFSAQLSKVSGAASLSFFWLRVNGSDLANTAGEVAVQGTNAQTIAAWNYILKFNAGDVIQLMWSTQDTSIQLLATGASAPVPAVPSIITTIQQVTNIIPGAPTGNAGGQLSGTYPNPNINSSVVISNLQLANLNVANVAVTFPNSFLSNSTATLGNTTVTLGSTTTSVGNLTLNNATIVGGNVNNAAHSGGTFANANITSVAATFPNSYLSNSSATIGNTVVTLGSTVSNLGNLTLANTTIISGNANVTQVTATNGLIYNSNVVSSNATVGVGFNAMSAGNVTVNGGVTVTVSAGSRWVIV